MPERADSGLGAHGAGAGNAKLPVPLDNLVSVPGESGRLAGKSVLVTGAGSGIGKAVALRSALEGASLLLVDRDEAAVRTVAETIGAAAHFLQADLRVAQEVDQAVDQTVSYFGRLDVLVNNAGVHDQMQPAEQFSDDIWDMVFDVNVRGMAFAIRAALRHMLPAQSGAIVNMGSTSALLGNNGGAAYSASKGAVHSLTKQVAHDVASRGVRVNAIGAGGVATNILATAVTVSGGRDPGPQARFFLDKAQTRALASVPMGRMAEADEIARAVVFLASDDASYITGAILMVDGGSSIN